MTDEEVIKLFASFEDGKLIIERQDGNPISIITHSDIDGKCIEVLEFGCQGNAVKALQALLNAHGQHLEVDGIFGNLTQTALLIFQDQNGLNATGECSYPEWCALIGG